jgi:hypothetical protein
MAFHRKGVAKKNRGCQLCKPWRKEGNGGSRPDRRLGVAKVHKHKVSWVTD